MGELIRFPYMQRVRAIREEMPLADRLQLRQLVEDSVLFKLENVVDIEDIREEMLHRRLI